MDRKKCFIIQPLDDEYKKRCNGAYKPAIEKAGLFPYRVDEQYDPQKLKIQQIQDEIENSDVCLAEITKDNPNVWYEFGFADGCGIPIVLICEDGKREKLPFDVNQRDIYFYKTDSPSGWKELERTITDRLTIAVQNAPAKKAKNDVVENGNKAEAQFGKVELQILRVLYYGSDTDKDKKTIKRRLEMLHFSSMDITDAFNRLDIEQMTGSSFYVDYYLTEKGRRWCLENNELLRK